MHITDDRHAGHRQVRNVRLAIRVARHSAQGWDNPALPDDVAEIGRLLQLGPSRRCGCCAKSTPTDSRPSGATACRAPAHRRRHPEHACGRSCKPRYHAARSNSHNGRLVMDMQSIQNFFSTTVTELAIKVLAAIAFWIVGRWLIGRVIA